MSGDCDLCGSYDHVETKCDAYEEPATWAACRREIPKEA